MSRAHRNWPSPPRPLPRTGQVPASLGRLGQLKILALQDNHLSSIEAPAFDDVMTATEGESCVLPESVFALGEDGGKCDLGRNWWTCPLPKCALSCGAVCSTPSGDAAD